MGDSHARAPGGGARARGAQRVGYRARLLQAARFVPDGVLHLEREGESLLRWEEVWFAVAAEVGEPEGVRTIVFDLVLGRDELGWRAVRADADPGPNAEEIARAIHAGVGQERRGPSIKSLASDGLPSWWFADLEGFEEAVLAALPPAGG